MRRIPLVLAALALLLAPAAYGHVPAGTPKTTCETYSRDYDVHEYGGSSARPSSLAWTAEPSVEQPALVLPGAPRVDGALGNCYDGSDPAVTGDGHAEFAVESGVFLYSSGNVVQCYGVTGDHAGNTFTVSDTTWGGFVDVVVVSDASLVAPAYGPDCGDGIIQPCTYGGIPGVTCDPNDCFEAFPVQQRPGSPPLSGSRTLTTRCGPGADGAVRIIVGALEGVVTTGHIVLEKLPDIGLCFGTNSLEVSGVKVASGAYQGGATIKFTVGPYRTLVGESVTKVAGAAPNPNPVAHTGHTGTGAGSQHTWTIGGSADFLTRTYEYKFVTRCIDGTLEETKGRVGIYN